jgi:hypothetical protein
MATVGSNDDNEWQKLPSDQKVQHKVHSNLPETSFFFHVCFFSGMESSDDWL